MTDSSVNDDEPNPYRPPLTEELVDPVLPADQSVFREPWMEAGTRQFMPHTEQRSDVTQSDLNADPEHSVWDEPSLSTDLSGQPPRDAVKWIGWYHQQRSETSPSTTWLVAFSIAVVSGFCAVLGTFFTSSGSVYPVVMTVIGAPVTEEICKIALVIYVVEKRPWLFGSTVQIVFCGLASGLVFAVLENLLYLNVYIDSPSAALTAWRWTVCTALHVTCTAIASIGCARVWTEFQNEERMPRLSDGARWIVAAVVIHGFYNAAAIAVESSV